VTTDGFITDLPRLEEMLTELPHDETILFRKYKSLRNELAGNREALEVKSDGKGIVS
jgi:hypothetical protein